MEEGKEARPQTAPVEDMAAAPEPGPPPVGREQLREWNETLRRYRAAKAELDRRVVAAEEWWRLRNANEEGRERGAKDAPGQFRSVSGWLHNVIVSKHADAMDNYPTANVLPRESGDRAEAAMLSSVIPAILEQNRFESTYSDAMWQKLKTGTGVYKVTWDARKLQGLGDIRIQRVNLLNLFWEPNITDIQESRIVFHLETADREELERQWPVLRGRLKSGGPERARFRDEDSAADADKVTVVEVYYKKHDGARQVLHYCKYAGDVVLYATENENGADAGLPPELSPAVRGLYDHGRYPFVFDRLFPVEGSPCGYGFVDLCRNPQTEIDLLKTAFLRNAMVGATPRYFIREDGEIDEKELCDLNRPTVRVSGNLGQDSLRVIDYKPLDGNYVAHLQNTIRELRETSGNTETAGGVTHGGVTAASAIAALQEAAGKGSRDAAQASYRCFAEIVELVIELIRQFYDLPRQFRILGDYGVQRFVSYSNEGLQPRSLLPSGYRLPVFDVRIEPQRKSPYTQLSQNELALQFFHEGFFDPRMADQALACLDMMSFEGKDALVQQIARSAGMTRKLLRWQQLSLTLARRYAPELLPGLAAGIIQTGTYPAALPAGGGLTRGHTRPSAGKSGDPRWTRRAREQSRGASRPRGRGN